MGRGLKQVGGVRTPGPDPRVHRSVGRVHGRPRLRHAHAATRDIPIAILLASLVVTVIYGMVTGSEPASIARIALIGGLVACIIGLKLIGGEGV